MRLPQFCCTTLVRFRLAPLGQTLPRSQGWRRSKFKPPKIVVVQIHAVGSFSSPHALHTVGGKKTTGGPSVRVVKPCRKRRSTQPTRDCTALTATAPAHQSLRLLRVCHFSSGQVQSSAMLMDGVCLDATRSRHPPDVARKCEGILSWVHRNSAEATRRVDAALDLDLSVDRQPTSMFRCASSLLTWPSVIAADGGTLITRLLQSSHALLLAPALAPTPTVTSGLVST